jgi:hypothetical protein
LIRRFSVEPKPGRRQVAGDEAGKRAVETTCVEFIEDNGCGAGVRMAKRTVKRGKGR